MDKIKNQVITASAGTGKTYRLSVEYIKCLLEILDSEKEDLNCFSSILVITFTRKATAEIRSRVFRHIRDLTERRRQSDIYDKLDRDISDEDFDRLEQVYRNMCSARHKMQIRTIDGFINAVFTNIAARLININNITVINDDHKDDIYIAVMKQLWQDDALRKTFADVYLSKEEGLKDAKSADKCIYIIKGLIRQREAYALYKGVAPQEDNDKAAECLRLARAGIESLVDLAGCFIRKRTTNKNNPNAGDLGSVCENLKVFVKNLESETPSEDKVSRFCEILKSNINDKWVADNAQDLVNSPIKIFNGNKVRYKLQAAAIDREIKPNLMMYLFYRNGGIAKLNQAYLDMLNGIYDIYNEVIRSRQEFTHEDVLLSVYDIMMDSGYGLTENGIVTAEFMKQMPYDIRYMMIDEFQDTSVLQWAALLPILRSLSGRFVIVGDEKQAIYGWRGGEKELLGKTAQIFGNADELSLDTSYRSYHNVIRYINRIFADKPIENSIKDCIYKELGGRWVCPKVECSKKSEQQKGLFRMYFDRYYKGNKNSKASREESQCLEYFIKEAVVPMIRDNPDRYGETAILARKNGTLEEIAACLSEYGIPSYIESSSSLFAAESVIGIMALLRYLAFDDYHSFFEFVRSSVICADSEQTKDLMRHYCDKRDIDYADKDLSDKYPFLRRIAALRSECGSYRSVFALISRIYCDFGVLSIYNDTADVKSLHQLLNVALEFDTELVDYTKSLAGFLLYTDDIYTDIKPDGVESANAVKLMTIHKSKGLEFNNVFVLHIAGKSGNNADPLKTLYTYNKDMSETESLTIMKSRVYTALKDCTDCDFSDEYLSSLQECIIDNGRKEFIGEMNNLYVALTRPAMNLIVYNIVPSSAGYDEDISSVKKDLSDESQKSLLSDKNAVLALYEQFCTDRDDNHLQTIDVTDDDDSDAAHKICVFSDGEWCLAPSKDNRSECGRNNSQVLPFCFDMMKQYIDYSMWQHDVETLRQHRMSDAEFVKQLKSAKESFAERKRLFGIAVHDYMSKIIYADDEERSLAKQMLYMKYGNILDEDAIEEIGRITDRFIAECHYLFDSNVWDRVLTEQWLADEQGNLNRLDRLMFDSRNKRIMIADYKTGANDEQQLERYEKLITSLLGDNASEWTVLEPKDFYIRDDRT